MNADYNHSPPRLAARFLRWYCRPELLDEVEGDLYELFQRRVEAKGLRWAQLIYWLNVLMFLHPDYIRKRKQHFQNNPAMLKNYFTVAIRNVLAKKFYSIINILGLAVGIAAFLMITQYVVFERSYDDFHDQQDQIYRVQLDLYLDGELVKKDAENFPGVGPALKAGFPEIVDYTRLYNMGYKNNIVLTYEDAPNGPVQLKQDKLMYADASLFTIFSFEMVKGNPATALENPFSIIISETMAEKYFGDADPMGKTLRLQDDDFNDESCEVTGVFKDIPENSHLTFEVLISYNTLYNRGDWAKERYDLTWDRNDFYTYVLVEDDTSPTSLEAQFPAVVKQYKPGLAEQNRREDLLLQPLESIHLYSDLQNEAETNGNAKVIFSLLIIASFILIIAWINYVNLSTARATDRSREVGVRKALGAFRQQLVRQFLAESLLVNLVAIIIAALLVIVFLPTFNALTGLQFSVADFWSQPWLWIIIAGLFVFGSLLSGLYPAFVLSSFRPAAVLKGKFRNSSHGVILRKTLVVFQFAAAITLVAGTFIVYQQMQYMLNQDLGFSIDQTLVLERPSVRPQDWQEMQNDNEQFKNELLQHSSIEKVAGVHLVPGKKRKWLFLIRQYGTPQEEAQTIRLNGIDYDFIDMFEMNLLAGRNFSKGFTNDQDTSVIITESAVSMLGFDSPEEAVGQTVTIGDGDWHPNIVGVVNDFHQESLKTAIEPMLFILNTVSSEYYVIKVNTQDLEETVAYIEDNWEATFPGNPFSYFFLDDYFNRQYQSEQRFSQLISIFALLALFIGGLGLFGLSAFTTQQRKKEIGVRKVLGASVSGITVLLARDFIKLIGIAIIIALPLTYFALNEWLQSYAFRVAIGPEVLLAAGVGTMLIAVLTVSWQSIKAAVANPVDSLRSE
ncbi:MAG: ABC transporter permease [Tunicatimonas sp.]|uniref:ABC transporter permease n=1 Tax=Tunicatimonas sp. TaxID=1940096 RepID=UPI003C74B036